MPLFRHLLIGLIFSILLGINPSSAGIKDYSMLISTITFLNKLELSKSQIKELLPIVREAVNEKERIEKEILDARQKAIGPYESLKNELAMQQTTKESEDAARDFHNKVKNLYQVKLVKTLLKYERQIDHVLTPNQISYLVKYDSGSRPSQGAYIAEKVRKKAVGLLDSAREMNSFDYDQRKYKLCRDFLTSCSQHDLIDIDPIDIQYEIERMILVLDRARKMFSHNYKDSREELVNRLYPGSIKSRPVKYGTRYIRGEPLEVLSKTSRILFTTTAFKALEEMSSNRSDRDTLPLQKTSTLFYLLDV